MNCTRCGFQNDGSSKFCIKCGNVMVQPQPVPQVQPVQQPQQVQSAQLNNFGNATNEFVASQPVQSQPVVNQSTTFSTPSVSTNQTYQSQSTGSLNYLFFIIAVLLKPVTSIKEELNKFSDTKTSIVFALIVSVATTVINLVKTIFATVAVKSYDWSTGKIATTWNWDNLESLKWGEVIFKNFLLYAGILLAIALVYYLASLIIKKNASFQRLLGIASISVIPMVICSLVISPLVGKIYDPLGIITAVIGGVYTLILLFDGVNRELSFEDDDTKIYTNLACLSILGSVGYYVFMKFFFSISGIGGLDNLFDLFK